MNRQFYIPYFAINPYGVAAPVAALEAAAAALESQLGGAWQVLAAKTAFEEAGGLQAHAHGIYTSAITRWSSAAQAAVHAACRVAPPPQALLADRRPPTTAYVDVIAAARYGYSVDEWLQVFMTHFGMSDHCDSPAQALGAGRRWLAIAAGACPIAAADQEIRERCQRGRTANRVAEEVFPAPAVKGLARRQQAAEQAGQVCHGNKKTGTEPVF